MKTQKLLLALATTTTFMATGCSKTCTVTFDSKGGSEVAAIHVTSNNTIEKPTNPSNRPYAFCGWYLDEGYQEPFDFKTPIVKDTTLYAKWDSSIKFTYAYHNSDAGEDTLGFDVYWLPYDPLSATYCDLLVDWGDTNKETIKAEDVKPGQDIYQQTLSHTYKESTPGKIYTINIQGAINGITFDNFIVDPDSSSKNMFAQGNHFIQSIEINESLYNSIDSYFRLGGVNNSDEISQVSDITLPEDLVAISKDTLAETSIKSFVVSDKINEIGKNAFKGDVKLETIDFTNASGLYSINDRAFMTCKSLTEIVFPSNLAVIGDYAFEDCSNLKTLTFTSNLPPKITESTFDFDDSSKLAKVYVPKGRLNDYAYAWRMIPKLVKILAEKE